MKHLFVCREYPPAAYPPGGIGTYLRHITALLARAGETVHVIAHRWDGAPRPVEESEAGRLIVHRVALDESVPDPSAASAGAPDDRIARGLLASRFPSQAFSWQAALLAEHLVATEGIDVIEAQEWEAPLYYLQLRRALGLGPAARPPCVVHMHSPTETIFAANDWDTTVADYPPAAALEEYSIKAADHILCPSRFMASHARARYGIDGPRASVIPYPLGEVPSVHRDARTWSAGSICHVGRLEPRKGVLEWADAVASIALEHPDLEIVFVGGDTPLEATGGPLVGEAVRSRVPASVRRHFRFLGSRDRAGVIDALSGAFASVVPSRWENFPYSCIEAMGSGLPVIASPNGGMSELVVDGVSGWIAADATPAGLAGALRRALETPAEQRRRMGEAAAETVRRTCDNAAIVGKHLELKGRLARARASPSVHVPRNAAGELRPGIGVVVSCPPGPPRLEACLSGIRAQAEAPAAVCIVCDEPPGAASRIPQDGRWRIVLRAGKSVDEAALEAARDLAATMPALAALAFVEPRARLEPGFISTCGSVFAGRERLGVFSAWTREAGPRDRVHVQPCPAAPHVGDDGLLSACVVAAAPAFLAAAGAGEGARAGTLRAVFDHVVSSGWDAVTYPAVLCTIEPGPDDGAKRHGEVRYSSMARAVQRLHTPLLQWFRECSPAERRAFLRQAFGSPLRSGWWLAKRAIARRAA